MSISLTNILSILSLLVSAAAAFTAYKVYKRNKTFENENHIYKFKLDHFQNIISGAYQLLDVYEDGLSELKNLKNKDNQRLEEIVDELDDASDDFRQTMIDHSFFLSKEIVSELDRFYEKFIKLFDVEDEELMKVEFDYEKFENYLVYIINMMRDEIGIDKVNLRLKKRMN